MSTIYEGWVALTITLPGIAEDDPRIADLSAALFELGAGGIETQEPPGELVLVASFPPEATPDAEGAQVLLEALGIGESRIAVSQYAAIDWSTHWRQHFRPIVFGLGAQRVDVVPSWLEPPADAGKVLRIDPSSAFGTGLHATTAMCIERVVALSPVESILDVGTGTGIIALAALVLGAKRAVATDIDPEALRVAAENAERNQLSLVISGDEPASFGEKFAVVVANILARPLIELASELEAALAADGRLILSGITLSQIDDVVRAYELVGLRALEVHTREDWACVELART